MYNNWSISNIPEKDNWELLPHSFEIGLRKHLNADNLNIDFYNKNQQKLNIIADRHGLDVYNNDWWYLCKPLRFEDFESITNKFMKLYDDCMKEKFL